MDKKILVLIPCYNEEQNIVNTVERLKDTCPDVDFLVINDCSTDGSAALLQSHGYPFLDLPVNLGIGGGVQCGYRYAKRCGYDIAVQMDGDGQHDPAYLYEIVQPVLDGRCDMCIGSRFIKKEGFQTSFMRRVGIRFLSSLIWLLCGRRVLDVTSGFRATSARMTAYFADHYATDDAHALAILRRPGVGILAEMLAAVIEVVFLGSPVGPLLLLSAALQGIGSELPFALTRYRRFGWGVFAASGALGAGLVFFWTAYRMGWYGQDLLALRLGVQVLSGIVLGGLLARVIVRALERTGVLADFAIGAAGAARIPERRVR